MNELEQAIDTIRKLIFDAVAADQPLELEHIRKRLSDRLDFAKDQISFILEHGRHHREATQELLDELRDVRES